MNILLIKEILHEIVKYLLAEDIIHLHDVKCKILRELLVLPHVVTHWTLSPAKDKRLANLENYLLSKVKTITSVHFEYNRSLTPALIALLRQNPIHTVTFDTTDVVPQPSERRRHTGVSWLVSNYTNAEEKIEPVDVFPCATHCGFSFGLSPAKIRVALLTALPKTLQHLSCSGIRNLSELGFSHLTSLEVRLESDTHAMQVHLDDYLLPTLTSLSLMFIQLPSAEKQLIWPPRLRFLRCLITPGRGTTTSASNTLQMPSTLEYLQFLSERSNVRLAFSGTNNRLATLDVDAAHLFYTPDNLPSEEVASLLEPVADTLTTLAVRTKQIPKLLLDMLRPLRRLKTLFIRGVTSGIVAHHTSLHRYPTVPLTWPAWKGISVPVLQTPPAAVSYVNLYFSEDDNDSQESLPNFNFPSSLTCIDVDANLPQHVLETLPHAGLHHLSILTEDLMELWMAVHNLPNCKINSFMPLKAPKAILKMIEKETDLLLMPALMKMFGPNVAFNIDLHTYMAQPPGSPPIQPMSSEVKEFVHWSPLDSSTKLVYERPIHQPQFSSTPTRDSTIAGTNEPLCFTFVDAKSITFEKWTLPFVFYLPRHVTLLRFSYCRLPDVVGPSMFPPTLTELHVTPPRTATVDTFAGPYPSMRLLDVTNWCFESCDFVLQLCAKEMESLKCSIKDGSDTEFMAFKGKMLKTLVKHFSVHLKHVRVTGALVQPATKSLHLDNIITYSHTELASMGFSRQDETSMELVAPLKLPPSLTTLAASKLEVSYLTTLPSTLTEFTAGGIRSIRMLQEILPDSLTSLNLNVLRDVDLDIISPYWPSSLTSLLILRTGEKPQPGKHGLPIFPIQSLPSSLKSMWLCGDPLLVGPLPNPDRSAKSISDTETHSDKVKSSAQSSIASSVVPSSVLFPDLVAIRFDSTPTDFSVFPLLDQAPQAELCSSLRFTASCVPPYVASLDWISIWLHTSGKIIAKKASDAEQVGLVGCLPTQRCILSLGEELVRLDLTPVIDASPIARSISSYRSTITHDGIMQPVPHPESPTFGPLPPSLKTLKTPVAAVPSEEWFIQPISASCIVRLHLLLSQRVGDIAPMLPRTLEELEAEPLFSNQIVPLSLSLSSFPAALKAITLSDIYFSPSGMPSTIILTQSWTTSPTENTPEREKKTVTKLMQRKQGHGQSPTSQTSRSGFGSSSYSSNASQTSPSSSSETPKSNFSFGTGAATTSFGSSSATSPSRFGFASTSATSPKTGTFGSQPNSSTNNPFASSTPMSPSPQPENPFSQTSPSNSGFKPSTTFGAPASGSFGAPSAALSPSEKSVIFSTAFPEPSQSASSSFSAGQSNSIASSSNRHQ